MFARSLPIPAQVERDVMRPGLEPGRLSQLSEVQVRFDQGFLTDVPGVFGVPQHPSRKAEDALFPPSSQTVEGVEMSVSSQSDELGIF